MNIVIANPCKLDNGQDVILFPSRWDSGVPRAPFRFYPYELAALSSLLKRELPDANVKILDGNLMEWDGDRYAEEIGKYDPDVLITECSALTYSTMTRVISKVYPGRAILCGPMAAYAPEQAKADGWDDCVTGEYEHKVLSLLKGEPEPTGYVDLDWLPWPEDEDIDRSAYYEINHYAPPAMIQMYPTRGCPLSCTFCVVPSYYGGHGKSHKSHRCRDVEDVCDEIEYCATKYANFQGCYFNEEAHNANAEWFALFCETLIRRGLNRFQYDAMCGMWTFTRELVQLAKAAGYRQIRFGVESTSEQVGRAIKKTIHKAKTEEFLGWLKEAGIGAYITLQVGAMGSTEQSDLATIADAKEWIRKGWVQKWQLSTSTPQPGTPFFDLCKQNGWLVTEDFNQYNGWNAVVNYENYPAHRIQMVRNGAGL